MRHESRLARAIERAEWLRVQRGRADVVAARLLDRALARDEPADPEVLARALSIRAELAAALGETVRAQALRREFRSVSLFTDDAGPQDGEASSCRCAEDGCDCHAHRFAGVGGCAGWARDWERSPRD